MKKPTRRKAKMKPAHRASITRKRQAPNKVRWEYRTEYKTTESWGGPAGVARAADAGRHIPAGRGWELVSATTFGGTSAGFFYWWRRRLRVVVALVVGSIVIARQLPAQCNVYAEETFSSGSTSALGKDQILRARIDLANTDAQSATVRRFAAVLNCPVTFPYFGCVDPRCENGGPILAFWGNLSTTCPTLWGPGHYFGAEPNEIVFEALTPFVLPPHSWPSYCTVWFDLKRVGGNPNTTFATVSGFRQIADDAVCADGSHSGAIDNNTIRTGP